MTELLIKEKQFIKLNEQLDRMSITAATGHEAAATKADSRFYTYQKSKGASTPLRKQSGGGGDEIKEKVDVTNIKVPRTNITTINKIVGGETYHLTNRHNYEPPTSISHGQATLSPNMALYRTKQTKCSEPNRPQTYSPIKNSRIAPNNSNFTIKYRNPKFLESPSLEVLVKEESSSLRCQMEASCIGSLNSVLNEEGILTERRSQSSNHTVASKKNISSDGLIKFLKSKIVILEEDHARISQEMSKQKELFSKTLEHTKTLEHQRDQAKVKNYALTEQLGKIEKQLEEANKRLKECGMDQNDVQKGLETSKRELKLLKQTNSNLEKRMFKAHEELESARNAVALMKNAEREQNEASRKESDAKDMQIKSLKKQRANLLNAYKKQLFLIDNLKRQNIILEQAKMLDFGEKEFSKVLNWNIER